MSFDDHVPHAIATLETELKALWYQIQPLQDKINSGQGSGGCSCDCSACDDCEDRYYLSDTEIEETEAELKPLTKRRDDIETTIKRLKRWAGYKNIPIENKR